MSEHRQPANARQREQSAAPAFGPGRRPGRGGMGGPHGLGAPVEKAKDFRGTLRRLVQYLRPHSLRISLVMLFAVASTVFAIFSPRVLGRAITKLFEGMLLKMQGVPGATIDFAAIASIMMTLAGLYALSAAFSYAQQYIMAGVAQETVRDMRRAVNDKIARLPLRYFDQHTHGEVLSRVTNDVDTVSNTLQQSLTQMITAVVTLVGVTVMMLTISPALTAVTLVTLPMSLVVTVFVAKRSQRYFIGQQRTLGELNGHVEEMYTGHRVVKAFGREQASIANFERTNEELYQHGWKANFVSGLIMPMMHMIGNIGYVIVAVVGGIYVTRRLVTIGDVQAFIQYSRQFSQPIVQTASIANIMQSTVAAAERVFAIMDEAEEPADPVSPRKIEAPRGAVRFADVSFSYEPAEPLIEGMNIDVHPGQTVAIVGPTGAGKTTLVNLLMRFYDVNAGQITVDGIDVRDMRRHDLRTVFGMVLQDTWLFNGTIRDNIAYGRDGASEEDIRAAAMAAHADHFIRTLPGGYDTVLNEEASNISQGQMQLLTIARAFLADPAVLILDEATSSVDTRTEMQIQAAMGALMHGRTSFVIAHRLSTVRNADLTLVMNEGAIIEQGSHEELLGRDGFYAELYNSQFAGRAANGPGPA